MRLFYMFDFTHNIFIQSLRLTELQHIFFRIFLLKAATVRPRIETIQFENRFVTFTSAASKSAIIT